MFERILVPVDGSTHSFKALDLAVDLAEKYGAELFVLNVYRHHSQYESSHSLVRARVPVEPPDNALRDVAKEIVGQAVSHAKAKGIGKVTGLVRRGQPARTIVQTAKEKAADVIVMGNRGLGDVSGFLLGSVSHKVSSLVECTVITVK
ncbi:universal stress protein [Futiania mangrovi]|uniref:Universal stress protein n=1 Tax=Futiania mangrovi TaxID=2959716 RepID=A0A9J6PBY2_9PROT|nr:universal stress protein [Futiania mangrovii]MCP1336773.1 universal stress protein [Futiania mangrovii]